MCDLEAADCKPNGDGRNKSIEAPNEHLDNISIASETSLDHGDHQRLHQTTQSLLMASSMMAGIVGGSTAMPSITSSCSGSLFGSNESVGTTVSTVNTIKVNLEELLRENYALRERLKEVTTDRDRLVCEVSNLRLELDMSELKRLPEESFPQKAIDRSNSAQYGIAAPPGSISSTSTSSVGGGGVGVGGVSGGYIYLQQQQYAPSTASSNSSVAINYPPATQQQHMIYQHYNQQYPTCHQQQQQQLIHQSANVAGGNISSLCSSSQMMTAANAGMHYNPHQQHHHHLLHGHHHHHGGAVVIAGSGVGIGSTGSSASAAMQQNMHKKNSMRNGVEVHKRSRAQTAYELSQDLLEKQIELLERKYGGICARNAAITIQRAFRHYMMVKKFASITAMAKAEKRLSRRMMLTPGDDGQASNNSSTSAYGSATESQQELTQAAAQNQASPHQQHQQQQQQPRVTIMAGPAGSTGGAAVVAGSATALASAARTPPIRSLSLRERRQLDSSPIPRSQSGASPGSASCSSSGSVVAASAHPHVNMLHAAESHYYSGMAMMPSGQPQQFYPAHCGGVTYHAIPHDVSFSSVGSSHLDSSLNASWVSVSGANISGTSPHTPYYSAAQIYMRPKALTPAERKKVPPEVPKRTSSITAQQQAAQQLAAQQHQQMLMMRQTPPPPAIMRSNGLCKTAENGSLTSVQSSGSDSSVTSAERIAANSDLGSDRSNSPNTWKRGTNLNSSNQFTHSPDPSLVMSTHQLAMPAIVSAAAATAIAAQSDENVSCSHTSAAQYGQQEQQDHQISVVAATTQNYKVSETIRKRQYRVGLNLFNKKPEKGITYLIRRGFLENTPQGVARFLISRKGLSRQMIGEYLGNLQNQFNMAVLNCFALELDLSGMQVDVALRKFQAYFRMPGEAQKIERLMEIFSHRYCQCNQDIVGRLRSSDTIFVLAFAIIMLNTDLHTPNLKPDRRMRVEDFVKNLRGIDDCHDIDKDMLGGIYERVKANEFKPGSDHVTQVMKVQATIVGKKPNLALPHRRLVCYCRLYEIPDVNKKERPGVHQREVFLFNDLLVITKIFSKKKSSVTYTFRNSFPLCGMVVTLLDVPNYQFCIQLSQKVDGKNLITFNARNEHDRCKFAEDLKESISEMDEMEALRIEAELERQKSARNRATGNSENRDSGVADVEVCPCPFQTPQTVDQSNCATSEASQQLKRSALSNSLLDMHEQFGNDKPQRRGSVGSLDSGMSISFQSTTTSSASRENAAVIAAAANAAAAKMRFPPPAAVNAGAVGGPSYQHQAGPGYPHANMGHQQQSVFSQHLIQQQLSQNPQQQSQLTGRIPGRDRKLSRSDENGRSTDV